MRWISNLYDPRLPDAPSGVLRVEGETQRQAWKRQQQWLQGKEIGDPLPSESYSVEQLRAQHIVGVYEP